MAVKVFYLRLTNPMVLFFFCQVQVLPLTTGLIQKRSECGENMVAESGLIQSPNFPRDYDLNLRCTWVITVPEDNIVKLTFDEFKLEELSSTCSYDYVKVYDGSSTSSNRLGVYCGFTVPSPLLSSSNTITVYFKTDDSAVRKGFSAQFTKVSTRTVTECDNPRSGSSMTWLYHQQYCYTAYAGNSFSYSEGKAFCTGNGGQLTSIHSIQEKDFIRSLVSGYQSNFWIGLRKPYLSEHRWEDGTPLDYLNWSDEDDDEDDTSSSSGDSSYSDDVVCASFQAPADTWVNNPCENKYHVVCKYKNDSSVPVTAATSTLPGFCPDEWYTFGAQCYKIFGKPSTYQQKNWNDANNQCKEAGSNLVSIHSAEEQSFLNTLTEGRRFKVWIGLSRPHTGGAFSWEDNSPLDFSYWNDGEPNNHLHSSENCVQLLDTPGIVGKWNDVPCHLNFPYICKMRINPVATAPGIDPTLCTQPAGWLKIIDSCYKVFQPNEGRNDSGSSWYDAQAVCEINQANLATVKNFGATADLSRHLENLDGYFWIGISRTSDHRYTWVGPAPLIYTNWQNDQPREVSNDSNCVAINTDGKWMVKDCNEHLPFICEVNEAVEVPTLPPHPHNMTCPGTSQKWHDFGGDYCYILEVNTRLKWYEASCRCTKQGGFLASFHSIHETNVILHHLKHFNVPLHIGFESNRHGHFVWTDESSIDFNNWESGQPGSDIRQCAVMHTDTGKWKSILCGEEYGYICSTLKVEEIEEFVPESPKPTVEKMEESVPGSHKLTGEEQLSPGWIALIAISVAAVLIIAAVALYYFYPSRRTDSPDSVPFAKGE